MSDGEMREGARGAAVRALHQKLRRIGFSLAVAERRDERFGDSTVAALTQLQAEAGLPQTGRATLHTLSLIDERVRAIPLPTEFEAFGTVRYSDGTPAIGIPVVLEDVDLFGVQRLGKAETDREGRYRIAFTRAAFLRAERIGPDLVAKAGTGDGISATSAVHFNAGTSTRIDLVFGGGMYRGPSEWERLSAAIVPLLDGRSAGELEERHLPFLVGETDFSEKQIAPFIGAVRAAHTARELGIEIAPEGLFALLRRHCRETVGELAGLDVAHARARLRAAIDEGAIAARSGQWQEAFLNALKALRAALARQTGVFELACLAGLQEADAARFAARVASHTGLPSALWSALREDSTFAASVARLQELTQIATLAGGHLPMVAVLNQRIRDHGQSSVGERLAAISDGEWLRMAREAGAPGEMTPESYADVLSSSVERAFPTHVVARHVAALEHPLAESVAALLRAEGDRHDIAEQPVIAWFRDRDPPSAEILDEASRVQRLYKIAGRARHLGKLANARSAGDIVRLGRGRFTASWTEDERETADAIYDRARRQHEAAVWLWSQYDENLNHPLGPGLDAPLAGEHGKRLPGREKLFGSLEFCGCEECRSVYSPAAYLTDLLAFTERVHVAGTTHSLREYLYSFDAKGTQANRRADLGTIQLTCENTNRVLPTIDLVNELLEYVALGPQRLVALGKPLVPAYQTTRPTEELLVGPEHTLDEVYDDVLSRATYPFSLPFDLGLTQARIFLPQLGLERTQLLELFASGAIDRAIDELGFVRYDVDLLCSPSPAPVNELYGLPLAGTWIQTLRSCKVFLERTRLTQAELLALCDCRFVAQLGGLGLNWPGSDCTLDRATLDLLDEPKALRLARFIRLAKRSGLSFRELDAFTHARAARADYTDHSLVELATLMRIRRRLSISFLECLTLWTTLDPSSYESIFLGGRVPASEQALFALNADGTELKTPSTLAPHLAVVAGAVGLAVDEIELLRADGVVTGMLDLANLSRLVRVATLCRALGIRPRELVVLFHLVDADPFAPATTETFLDRVALIRDSGLSIGELDFILRHQPGAVELDSAALRATLTEIRDGLHRIARELGDSSAGVPVPRDPEQTLLRTLLHQLVMREDAERLLILVDHWNNPRQVTEQVALVQRFATAAGMSSSETIALAEKLVTSNASATPPTDPTMTDRDERARALVEAAAAAVARHRRATLIAEKLASWSGLDRDLAADLLAAKRISIALDATSYADSTPVGDTSPYARWFDAARWLHKVAFVAGKLQLTPAELRAVGDVGSTGWLPLESLPTATVSTTVAGAFAHFASLLEVLRLRAWVRPGQGSLIDLVRSLVPGPPKPILERLEKMVGAPSGVLQEIGQTLAIADAMQLASGALLSRIRLIAALVEQSGVPSQTLKEWSATNLSVARAREIRDAVKARVAPDEWGAVARPLQDRLREAQRDALLAYVCGRDSVTPAQLVERLLIDVEMSACQLTSRIRQALNSVQLFVQRVSLGLEHRTVTSTTTAALTLDDESAAQWREWMSTYAFWRPARELFLYPESYLELGLRDDKTPFYDDFEKALTRGEISEEVIDEAYRGYLAKLDQVAQLDVLALYEETLSSGASDKRLHVFARTRGQPEVYFYRSITTGEEWTPWEKLDLDLGGDHLIPVVHDRTLYLFWATFKDKQEKPTIPENNDARPSTTTNHHWEIELAWSERKAGRWTPKKVARQKIRTSTETFTSEDERDTQPRDYTFYAAPVKRLQTASLKLFGDIAEYWDDLMILCRRVEPSEAFVGAWIVPVCGGEWPTRDVAVSQTSLPTGAMVGTRQQGMRLVNDVYSHSWDIERANTGGLPLSDTIFYFGRSWTFRVAHTTEIQQAFPRYRFPPYVFQDAHRSYAVFNNWLNAGKWIANPDEADPAILLSGYVPPAGGFDIFTQAGRLVAKTFYHPFACEFVRRLHHRGFDGLFDPTTQTLAASANDFEDRYHPGVALAKPYPRLGVDFGPRAAYRAYNWELFFFGALRVGELLSRAGRFEDALAWYHRIYDPRDPDVAAHPERAWRFAPFRNRPELQITEILALLDYSGSNTALAQARALVEEAVADWRRDPFQPFRIARHRLSAFMRAVKIRYVELLIAYGDALFREDTIESINVATQMYLWALTLLGPRPQQHPSRGQVPPKTYDELRLAPLDAFSNALVQLENFVPSAPNVSQTVPIPLTLSFYFCVPPNRKLMALWDTLEDRLFKIRHCQNIEGVERTLALFDAPLDPSALVRARALGLDLRQLLRDALVPLPIYRFPVVLQKALEVTNDLRAFGQNLLSAIEKRDGEALSLLRQRHERTLLDAVREVRRRQLDEANATLEALRRGRALAEERKSYYGSREFMNSAEKAHLGLTLASAILQDVAVAHDLAAAILHYVPTFQLGVQGFAATPTATVEIGGKDFAAAVSAAGSAFRGIAGHLAAEASMSATVGSYQRRNDDWDFQKRLAELELEQVDQQIRAAEVRVQIAEQELENHDRQIEHAREIDDFLRGKFSSVDLYDRTVQTLTSLHEQLRTLAIDTARRAEESYRFERADPTASFVESERVVGLKANLLAGERLLVNLRRMEAAYLESNRRELELVRHVSLATDFPEELLEFLVKRECEIELPEWYFDAHLPGHYLRRIKTIALSLACTVGPYEPVPLKLTLVSSKVRKDATVSTGYDENPDGADLRFRYDRAPVGPVVTSTATNDSGLFETNLRDERLLWFEGAGVVGRYKIECASDRVDIDPRTITDLVLHIRYTARDAGATLAKAAKTAAASAVKTARFFSVKTDFPDAWQQFVDTPPVGGQRNLTLSFGAERFPSYVASGAKTSTLVVYWKPHGAIGASTTVSAKSGSVSGSGTLQPTSFGLHRATIAVAAPLGNITLTFGTAATPDDIGIIVTLC